MKRPQIVNIIKKKYKRINLAFDKIIRHFNENDIHVFRVEVKKLRAFLRLVGAGMDETPKLKLRKKLHKFYKALGIIRSLQIQQQRIQEVSEDKYSTLPKTYLNLLTTKIATNIDLFQEQAKGVKPFKKGEQKLLSILPGKLRLIRIREFIRSEVNKLEKLLEPFSTADESLHSIRKLLKDLLYTWPYIKVEAAIILPAAMISGQEDLSSITKLLGDFQDTCVGLNLLHADYIDQEINESKRKLLRDIERKWVEEKEAIRKEIIKVFKKKIMPSHQTYPSPPDSDQLQATHKLLSS